MDLLLIIIIIFLPGLAHLIIIFRYNKYSKELTNNNLKGYEVARKILDSNNLSNVRVVEISGTLSDNYNPSKKIVSLSSSIFNGSSISSTAVAAHECGHAIQDKENYIFLRIRTAIFPIVRIATSISYWIILLGFLLELTGLLYAGIAFAMMGLIFELITLPVEFNASSRALKQLELLGLVSDSEKKGSKKVLVAAALTYVAGTLASALQVLRLILMAQRRR